MDTTQVLIIVAAVALVLLLIVIALRVSRSRKVKAMSPEQRDLHYAQRAHKKRVAELKGDYKAVEKDTERAVKEARTRLKDALAIGSDKVDAVKGVDGTVTLTSTTLTLPHGEHELTSDVTATATTEGSAPASEGDEDTRQTILTVTHGGEATVVHFKADQEDAVRAMAAKINSAASHVDEVRRQRDEATAEAEEAISTANEQATVRLNEAQRVYDSGIAESEAKVRAAEDKVRKTRLR
ncbi:hypothetical protein [Demequina globuliformis]|uniref:hypothetical protein n=1 Tax=Demequina globuliformis TaxID=676202 RepID=UPI0007862AA1|nr:hypothetical protein [Demequina globuliformis]